MNESISLLVASKYLNFDTDTDTSVNIHCLCVKMSLNCCCVLLSCVVNACNLIIYLSICGLKQ